MKPDEIDEKKQPTEQGSDGADQGKADRAEVDREKAEKPSMIQSVLRAATGQGGKKSPLEAALESAEKRVEAAAKEAIRASQAALAAQETASKAAEEAGRQSRMASQAALTAQAALKEAQAAKVALVARKAADRAAERAADEAARDVAREAAREAAKKAAELVARQAGARDVAEKAAELAAVEAAERAAREAAGQAAQVAARQAADEAAKGAAKDAAKQAAEQAAREAQAARRAEADKIARATRATRAARAAKAARAEKFAKRAVEKSPAVRIKRPKRINKLLIIALPVSAAVLILGVIVVHGMQIKNTAAVMCDKAEEALELSKTLEPGDEKNEAEAEAIQFFTYYVNYCPEDSGVFSELALLVADRARRAGSNRKAQEQAYNFLTKASTGDPDNEQVLRELADASMKFGRIEEAISHLTQLRQKCPDDWGLAVKLGECQVQNQKNVAATETFNQVVAEDRKNIAAYVALANLYRDKQGNPDDADAVINQMVANNESSIRAYIERARYWHRAEQINAANEDIKRALELDPNSAEVLVTAAGFATNNKDYETAQEYLDKAKALHPDDEKVQRAQMSLNLTLGKIDDVLPEYMERIKTGKSRDSGDLLTVADLQLRTGDLKGFDRTVERMRKADFREEILQYFEARKKVAEGDWRQAAYLLQRLRPNVAGWPEFLVQVDLLSGACYEQLRLPDRQLSVYQGLLNQDPTLKAARAGYASALFRTGKLDKAAAEYEKLEKSMGEDFLQTPALRNNRFQLIVARTMRLPENHRDWTELETFVDNLSKVDGVDETQLALMRAEVAAKKGTLDEARRLVDAQLKAIDPETKKPKNDKNPVLWNASAKLAAMAAGPKEGLRVLDEADKLVGGNLGLALTRADLAIKLGGDEGKSLLEALAANTEPFSEIEKVRLWRGLGAAWYRLRDRQKAWQYWKRAADSPRTDPQMLLVLFELGRELGDETRMNDATKAVVASLGSRSSEARYCEASQLVWKAQRGKIELKELIQAKQALKEASLERPSWHEIPRLEAEIALLENKPDDAIERFQEATALGPLSPVYLGQLVRLLFIRGRYEEAREVMNDLGSSQVSLTMKRLEAELNLRLGDLPQALELAAEAVKKSDRATDFLWYGELLTRTRKYKEAEKQFRRAVELDPKIPQGWVALVAVLVEDGRTEEAQRVVRQAQASLSEDETPLVMARCHHLLGDRRRAEQEYLGALATQPENLAVIRAVARFYMISGQSREARKYLGQILALAGRDPEKNQERLVETRRWMARVLGAEGSWRQLQQALALLDRNAENGRVPIEDLRLKAAMLANRKDRQSRLAAIKLLEEIGTELKEKDSELGPREQFALAQLYNKIGDWPTSRDLMLDLIRKQPKEPQFHAAYVQMLLEHGSKVDSIEYPLGRLERLAPDASMTRLLKAKWLAKKGKTVEAIEEIKKLVPRPVPKGKEIVLQRAAAALEEIEQYKPAREMLDEFARKVPGGSLAIAGFLAKHGTTDEALGQVEAALKQVPVAAVLPTVVNVFNQRKKEGDTIAPEQFARAEVWFKQAIEENPYSKSIQLQTAMLRDIQGNFAEQMRIYREFLARSDVADREKAVVWNNLAFLLAASNQEEKKALEMIDQAIDLLGPLPELLDTRAVSLIATGDYEAAIQDLIVATNDSPSGVMFFHLAQAHLAKGDKKAALRAFYQAQNDYQITLDDVPAIERDNYRKLSRTLKPN